MSLDSPPIHPLLTLFLYIVPVVCSANCSSAPRTHTQCTYALCVDLNLCAFVTGISACILSFPQKRNCRQKLIFYGYELLAPIISHKSSAQTNTQNRKERLTSACQKYVGATRFGTYKSYNLHKSYGYFGYFQ